MTFAELLNEPVFAGRAEDWSELQHRLLLEVRSTLPEHTIVLTGNDWGSVAGLLALTAERDPNVVYSFHLYEPAELTALAAYRADLDRAALARLPFLSDDGAACLAVAGSARDSSTADLMRFYCNEHWDAAKVAAKINAAADWARCNHAVVIAGEFGASNALNAAARQAWLATVRETCERGGIGWALWGYEDAGSFASAARTVRRSL